MHPGREVRKENRSFTMLGGSCCCPSFTTLRNVFLLKQVACHRNAFILNCHKSKWANALDDQSLTDGKNGLPKAAPAIPAPRRGFRQLRRFSAVCETSTEDRISLGTWRSSGVALTTLPGGPWRVEGERG